MLNFWIREDKRPQFLDLCCFIRGQGLPGIFCILSSITIHLIVIDAIRTKQRFVVQSFLMDPRSATFQLRIQRVLLYFGPIFQRSRICCQLMLQSDEIPMFPNVTLEIQDEEKVSYELFHH